MPTLYVENVPGDLYEALRASAREHHHSISAEVIALLRENVSIPEEMARRRNALQRALRIRARRLGAKGPFPSAEEMLREDRLR